MNKTDNSTDFIFTTRSFLSEAVLCWRKWRTNWIVAAGTSYMDLLSRQKVKLYLIIIRVDSYQREIISYFTDSAEDC